MTTEQIIAIVTAAGTWASVGLVGTLLEAIGERFHKPTLVRWGQAIEGLALDAPKLLRGSRFTNATVADIAKKVESEK